MMANGADLSLQTGALRSSATDVARVLMAQGYQQHDVHLLGPDLNKPFPE